MIGHIVLALVAAVCLVSIVTSLSPWPGDTKQRNDQTNRSALILMLVFVLVLAAEQGWCS